MGAASERRALLLEADDSYDPFLTIDINEYLIEHFSTLTAKHRQSVWSLCQNDEDFDYDSIHDQIDEWVYQFAEDNPDVILADDDDDDDDDDSSSDEMSEEDEDEDDDDESDSYLSMDLESYLEDNYDEIDQDEMTYMVELINWKFDSTQVYKQIDEIITKYNNGDYDAELDDDSEETPTE